MELSEENHRLETVLDWCASIVGPCEVISGDRRFHGRTTVSRLRSASGTCYLKVHGQMATWEREVHGYEQWARAFGGHVPQLLGVRDEKPPALLVAELAGKLMDNVQLPAQQEVEVWRGAGRALAPLHSLAVGECFGPCRRDGTCPGPIADAVEYVTTELERQTDQGIGAGYLSSEEVAIIRTAQSLAPAFAGEAPVPCHRDYGPANWLVSSEGVWAGVIDFEFAYWDVRVADFTRYPNWEWIEKPHLLEAFFAGYGRQLTSREEEQSLVAHTQYALSAIVWGCEHSYYGFVEEGRQALRHIAGLLGRR